MDREEQRDLIQQYRTGAEVFMSAVAEVGEAGLDAKPSPTEWTPRQVIHHLADAELRATIRLRQLLAEDDPVIQGYDEERYTERLPLSRSIATSLDAIRAARASNLELLELMSDDDWKRAGTHTESGPYSVEDWLRIYASHPHDHAEQIRRAVS